MIIINTYFLISKLKSYLEQESQLDMQTISIFSIDNDSEKGIKIKHRVRELCQKVYFWDNRYIFRYIIFSIDSLLNESYCMAF